MSITCIFRNWEKLRAIDDRPYEKAGIFTIKDVGALREWPQTTMRMKFLGIGGEDGFVTFAPTGSKLRSCRRPAGGKQQSTGLLHPIFESVSPKHKKDTPEGVAKKRQRTDSLACGRATAVATVHRTVAKSRLSNPMSSPTTKKPLSVKWWKI